MTVEIVDTCVNGDYWIKLPIHRAERVEWATPQGWERARIGSIMGFLEPGMTIIDVGAEEGDMPGLWATAGAKVAMIEPKPETWANIRAVWEGNGFPAPVGLFCGFASDVTDLHPERCLYLATGWRLEEDGWPLATHGKVIADHGFAHLAEEADSHPQVTLDDFASECLGRVDAITIDVEGSEHRVLIGAERILAEDRPLVWVSIHSDRVWVEDLYDCADEGVIIEWMDTRGYDATELARDHEAHFLFTPRA